MNSRTLSILLPVLLALTAAGIRAAAEEEDDWNVTSPPGDARSIPIDVTTGTWMNLDVSPDGKTIVFDLLGDIYRLPITGGDAVAINSGHAWSMQPRFSPDGREIAFISDAGGGDNIWVMRADGSEAKQLSREEFRLLNNPWWSPDGAYIAVRKHFTTTRSLGTGEIWLYHRNGGEGVAVIERPDKKHQKELGEPAFSPDGRFLYFSLDSTPGPVFQYARDSNGIIFEIRRHDLATGITESLVRGAGGAVRPTPSPDGKYLAFVRRLHGRSALFLKDLHSGRETPLHAALDQDLQEVWGVQGLYPNMAWTPDSKQIVFWAGGTLHRVHIDTREVTDIPFHVADERLAYEPPRPQVDVAPPTFTTHMVRNARVSPDGTRVVFESAGRLYLRDLPDGNPRRLTRNRSHAIEYDPAWSPDGRNIVFVAWSDDALGHLLTVPAAGGRGKRLTRDPGHYHHPRYSPDGEMLVFEKSSGGYLTSPDWAVQTGIFRMPATGGGAVRITDNGRDPHFGRETDQLYVTRTGTTEDTKDQQVLVRIDLNGDAKRTLATGPNVSRFEIDPDEKHLAWRENYHVYVVPLPPGGAPLKLGTEVRSLPQVRATGDGGNYPGWSPDGSGLYWSLGAELFQARVDDLFARGPDGEPAWRPPDNGVSLSMVLQSDVPDSRLALTGAKLVTLADEDGGVIDQGVLLIENNRIVAVGDRSTTIPPGYTRIDLSGKTVIPGLIDAHAHGSQGVGFIPQQNWQAHATLALGVTTIHDPSNDATEIFAAAEMQRTRQILAPRIFSTGNVVYGAKSRGYNEINSLEDARHHVRRLKAQGAMSIKNYNQPRREQRQQVTTAAREEGLLVVSEGASLYNMDLSMVADGNSSIEHNLPQSMIYDDVLQFWPATGVAYTPTLVVTYGGLSGETFFYQDSDVWKHPILSRFVPPHVLRPRSLRRLMAPFEEYHHVASARTATMLARRGVLVSIGAHGQREGLASHWEIWAFAQGGMTPIEAIRTATVNPANALGFGDDLGSLEPGKLADLVVIDADILSDIRQTDRISHVMLNGRMYEAGTLNEVHTGDRKTRPFYWQRD